MGALASGAGVVLALTRANGPGHLSPRLSLNAVCQVTRSGRAAAAALPLFPDECMNTLAGEFLSRRGSQPGSEVTAAGGATWA